MLPETELKNRNADYQCHHAIRDELATTLVPVGNLITGQNQNDGCAVSEAMMEYILQNQTFLK